jgi:hypothetical protein
MDNDTPEQLIQQAERLEKSAELWWDKGAFEVSKEQYRKAEKLRQQADEKSLLLS